MLRNQKSFSKKSLSNILELEVENLKVDGTFSSKEINDLQSDVNNNETDISNLDTRLSTAENDINLLENDILDLEILTQDLTRSSNQLSLESKTLHLSNGIQDTSITNSINSFGNFNSLIELTATSYRNYYIGLLGANNNNNNELAFGVDVGDNVRPKIAMIINKSLDVYIANDLIVNGNNVISLINSNTSNISSNINSISTLTTQQNTNTSNISSNTNSISSLTTQQSTNTSNISSNTNSISTLTSQQSTNTSNISSNTNSISTLTSQQNTNTSNISSNTNSISSLTSQQNTNTSNISSNTNSISSLQDKTQDISENNGSYIWNLSSLQKNISFQVNAVEKLNIGSSIVVPNGALLTNSIRPNTSNTYLLGQSNNFYQHAYISNITTSSISDLNNTITNLQYITGDISRPGANILSLGGTSFGDFVEINCQLNTPNITDVETEIILIGNVVVDLQTKTQDLTYSAGDYILATNLFELTAGNSGDCVFRLRADQDNSNENDNPMIAFAQDGTGDTFTMGFDNNILKFVSYYGSTSNNDNFQFYTNTNTLKFEIGSQIECHADMKVHHIYPDSNSIRNLGSSTLSFLKGYINDITTSNHNSIDTSVSNLESKTTHLTRNGNVTSIGNTAINSFVNINCQLNTPNISDIEGNFLAFGITLSNNSNSITTLNTKTANISASGLDTNINGRLVCRGTGLGDTSIDWGLTNDVQSPSKFFPMIFFDTPERDMFIGTATESGSSDAGIAFGISANGGNDPDIICYMANDGDVYFHNEIYSGHCKPAKDNTFDLGGSSKRWDDVRASNGFIQTSDRKEKNSIETLNKTEMTTFIKALNPVKYKFNGKIRNHTGLIADEVKEKMPWDSGLYIYDADVDRAGIRYTELISPMISCIQNLINKVETLEQKIEKLENIIYDYIV